MNQHHVWCDLKQGPTELCKMCACLNEKFPQIDGNDSIELAERYFPETIAIKPKKKIKEKELVEFGK